MILQENHPLVSVKAHRVRSDSVEHLDIWGACRTPLGSLLKRPRFLRTWLELHSRVQNLDKLITATLRCNIYVVGLRLLMFTFDSVIAQLE